jgi:hypothetical protein
MITSIFKKSSPINYTIVVLLLLSVFVLGLFQQQENLGSSQNILVTALNFITITASLFLTNFIVKKNGLTKNSSYSILFFVLLLLFFPSVFNQSKLILANFFILLALRRLISLQTLKAPKEKIFDASLWIFVASLFHFWSILFVFLVYVSIFYHVSRDYRNWLIPFVSLFTTVVIYLLFSLILNHNIEQNITTIGLFDFRMNYFKNNYENLAISMFAVVAFFFFFSKIIAITNRPLVLQASYKKIVFSFIIGVIIFIVSPNKSSDILLFTFFPLAVMGTNNIEYSKNKINQELAIGLTIILAFCSFFLQL